MIRNAGLRGSRKSRLSAQNSNPMDGIANLVDVMLVFACGLMVAIILRWDVDLNKIVDIIDKDELVQVEDMDKLVEDGTFSSFYEAKGLVYEDPETGKLYVLSK